MAKGKLDLVISPDIHAEYKRVARALHEKHPAVDITAFLELILLNSEMCRPDRPNSHATADPDDEMFVACALAAKARMIVSGDKHLLEISGYRGIEVLAPKQFVDKYLK